MTMPTHSVTIIEDSLHDEVAALEGRVAKLEAAVREPVQPVLPEGVGRESQVTLAATTLEECRACYGSCGRYDTEVPDQWYPCRACDGAGKVRICPCLDATTLDRARDLLQQVADLPLRTPTLQGEIREFLMVAAGGVLSGEGELPSPPAVATQSKPPRPPTCGEDISDCDFSDPMRLCDNDPHYYAKCCGWSCGDHKCRHARCVDDGTVPEGEDDD